MDPATVQALRDAKALCDEGILTEDEFKAKKAELLRPKPKPKSAAAAAPAPPPAAPAAKPKKEKKEKKPRKEKDADAPAKEKKAKKSAPLTLQDAGNDGVLVTGDGTYRAKGLLSSNGGSWNKKLKAWVFGAGTADALAAALRASTSPPVELTVESPSAGAKAAREQSIESARQDAIDKAAASGSAAALEVAAHKKAVLVKGETRKVKELLSALGGSWNNKLDGWVFPGKDRAAVLDALRKDPTNVVSDDGKGAAQSPASPAPAEPSQDEAEDLIAAEMGKVPDAEAPPASAKRKSVGAEEEEESLPEEEPKRRRSVAEDDDDDVDFEDV